MATICIRFRPTKQDGHHNRAAWSPIMVACSERDTRNHPTRFCDAMTGLNVSRKSIKDYGHRIFS